jgi:hypothetical protein
MVILKMTKKLASKIWSNFYKTPPPKSLLRNEVGFKMTLTIICFEMWAQDTKVIPKVTLLSCLNPSFNP